LNTIPERLKEEVEMFRKMLDAFGCNLRVAAPGIIKTFDANKQTATVQVAIKEKISLKGVVQDVAIALLLDVPVIVPKAGGFAITLPVQAGDECTVIFADNCFDAWWQSGGVQGQIDKRRHDLSDAMAILAPSSLPKVLSSYSTDSIVMRNTDNSNYIKLGPDGIELKFGAKKIEIDNTGVTIDGKPFLLHTHSGVTIGSGSTGGVVP